MPTQSTQPVNSVVHPTGNNRGLAQAYDLRDIAATMGIELKDCPAETLQDKATRARALRDCVSVWDSARDAIRIIKGRPLPGSLRPEKVTNKARKSDTGPLESLPTAPESDEKPQV